MIQVKHTEGSCSCGTPLTCPARIGAKGGRSTSPRKLAAARANARKGRVLYKCSACGARGRDISRWPHVKGGIKTIKTKCRKCGKTTTRRTR